MSNVSVKLNTLKLNYEGVWRQDYETSVSTQYGFSFTIISNGPIHIFYETAPALEPFHLEKGQFEVHESSFYMYEGYFFYHENCFYVISSLEILENTLLVHYTEAIASIL